MLKRAIAPKCLELASHYPVLTLTGPRQSGKTTLAKSLFPGKPYANLEDPDVRAFAVEDPRGFLSQYPHGVVLDEIQRVPELPSYLQGMVDADPEKGRYILTGSQQFELANSINQSLAGRTGLLRLLPLSMLEMRQSGELPELDRLLLMGSYPRLHQDGLEASDFYSMYFETYVQRDLRQLTQINNLHAFEKFVRLLAGRTGQLLNLASLGNDIGISHPTAAHWLSILEASYIVFLLQPLHANIGKRLIKRPKVYFYDTGLAAYLMGMETEAHVRAHPLKGALFENLVALEFLKDRFNRGKRSNLLFYRDSHGNEVDLILDDPLRPLPVEIKLGETPHGDFLKGIRRFREAHQKPSLPGRVVYGGAARLSREEVEFLPWKKLADSLDHETPYSPAAGASDPPDKPIP